MKTPPSAAPSDNDPDAAAPAATRAAPPRPIRGRGATFNPENRFRRESREGVDDGWAAPAAAAIDPPPGAAGDDVVGPESRAQSGAAAFGDAPDDDALPPLKTTVSVQQARTIISRNASPDIPFTQSINPYQGCEHGCVYCYARPSHAYLDLSPGLDFETRLFAKPNAAELLRAELAKPGYVLRSDRARREHRSVPADRARVEGHARDPRGAGRDRAPVLDRHQVGAGRARSGPDRADGRAQPRPRLRVGDHAGPQVGHKRILSGRC